MIEKIAQLDRDLLIFLNNLGSEAFDTFWLLATNQYSWTPLFLLLLYVIFKELGLKKGLFTFLCVVILVAFSDQFTNFIKYTTERVRPCNTENLQPYLRKFTYKPRGYSFWSGHASLSTAFSVFIILLFRKRVNYIRWLVLFPIVFGWSRIYLGVHYPLDVMFGYLSGILVGSILYKIYTLLHNSVFKEDY